MSLQVSRQTLNQKCVDLNSTQARLTERSATNIISAKSQELVKKIILIFNHNLAIATQTKQVIRFQDGVIS
ncbi:hypothetical protein [Nostoc sp. DSM 114167]|uniref:hypothetical protein n=1 Tax=Nostoc sp. DSM 114167 TaxID=3439050 RepID=UPI00404553DD